MKRVLVVASVASMISQFNMPNLELLKKIGYEVHVACNFKSGNTCDNRSLSILKQRLKTMGITYYQIDFARNVFNLRENKKAYNAVYNLLKNNQYTFLHCHSPIGGVIGRIAAVRTKTKVIYTAHGFHFYKGAPLKNWICYYPIERILAKYTDVLITINKEDYSAAQRFRAKKNIYVPGIGIELERFNKICAFETRTQIRKELGISEQSIVIISVGELNKNKNHQVIIDAIDLLNKQHKLANCYYLICGIGNQHNNILKLIKKLKLENIVKLLGYQENIASILIASDIFAFPSYREGLGLAALEAMACGLPLLTSNIHGINDYSFESRSGFKYAPSDVNGFAEGIEKLMNSKKLRVQMGENNKCDVQKFSLENVELVMKQIYENGQRR